MGLNLLGGVCLIKEKIAKTTYELFACVLVGLPIGGIIGFTAVALT